MSPALPDLLRASHVCGCANVPLPCYHSVTQQSLAYLEEVATTHFSYFKGRTSDKEGISSKYAAANVPFTGRMGSCHSSQRPSRSRSRIQSEENENESPASLAERAAAFISGVATAPLQRRAIRGDSANGSTSTFATDDSLDWRASRTMRHNSAGMLETVSSKSAPPLRIMRARCHSDTALPIPSVADPLNLKEEAHPCS